MMNPLESYFSEIVAETKTLSRSLEGMRLERARAFARAGRYDDAESELKDFSFSENRLKVAAYLILAKIYAQKGFKDKASMYWNHILKNDLENREAILGLSALDQTSSALHILRVIQTGILLISLGLIIFLGFSVFQSRFDSLENRLHTVSQEIAESDRNQVESLNAVQNNLRDQLASFEGVVNKTFERMAASLVESGISTGELIFGIKATLQSKIDAIAKRDAAQNEAIQISIKNLENAFQQKIDQFLSEQDAARVSITKDLDVLTESIHVLGIEIDAILAGTLASKETITSVQEQLESMKSSEEAEQP